VTLNNPSTIPHLRSESDHTYFFIKPHTLNELKKRIKLVDGMGETKSYIINKMGVDKMTHVYVTKSSKHYCYGLLVLKHSVLHP